MNNIILNSVLCTDIGKAIAQRGFLSGQLGHPFVKVCGEVVFAGHTTLNDAGTPGEASLCRTLHGRDLLCTEEFKQVAIRAKNIQKPCETVPHLYHSSTSDWRQETLGDFIPAASTNGTLAQCVL